jgi:integrase/recombinase XerC
MNTLARHVQRFLLSKYNKQTRDWYAKNLRPMVEFFDENSCLEDIGRIEAETYWQHLMDRDECWTNHPSKPTIKRPPSQTTLSNHLRATRTFWSEMVRQRLVEFNPFDHLSCPPDKRPAEMKAVSVEDLKAIWHAAHRSGARDFAIITVLATTGVRAGELVSMTIDQLDLRKGEAWVKGKRGWRKVFLGKTCVEAVETYLQERTESPEPTLWLGSHGGPLTDDGIRQLIYRLAEDGNIRGRKNLHAFRHRVAQAWLDHGINAEILSQALGHADVTVTLSIYGNQDDKRVRKTAHQAEMLPFREMDIIDGIFSAG